MAAKLVVIIVASFLRTPWATVNNLHMTVTNNKNGIRAEERHETHFTACMTSPPALYRTSMSESRPHGMIDPAARVAEYPRNRILSSPPLPMTLAPHKEFDVNKIWPFGWSSINYSYTKIQVSTLGSSRSPDPLTDQAYSVSVTQYDCGDDRSGDRRKCRKRKPRVEVEDEHAADRFQGTNTVWPLPSYPSDADGVHRAHQVFKMPVDQLDLLYTVRRGEESSRDDTGTGTTMEDGGPCGRR